MSEYRVSGSQTIVSGILLAPFRDIVFWTVDLQWNVRSFCENLIEARRKDKYSNYRPQLSTSWGILVGYHYLSPSLDQLWILFCFPGWWPVTQSPCGPTIECRHFTTSINKYYMHFRLLFEIISSVHIACMAQRTTDSDRSTDFLFGFHACPTLILLILPVAAVGGCWQLAHINNANM